MQAEKEDIKCGVRKPRFTPDGPPAKVSLSVTDEADAAAVGLWATRTALSIKSTARPRGGDNGCQGTAGLDPPLPAARRCRGRLSPLRHLAPHLAQMVAPLSGRRRARTGHAQLPAAPIAQAEGVRARGGADPRAPPDPQTRHQAPTQ